jgi:hypothetical protein
MTRHDGIALAVRVRDEWSLVRGLLESVRGICDEAWVMDDASEVQPPASLRGVVERTTIVRSTHWSGRGGALGEGLQRDHLLQLIKRRSRCPWVLQLDADERLSDPAALVDLIRTPEVDAWALPLVDYYITPKDAERSDDVQPGRVREWFGIETRWTLALFRAIPTVFVSRGDVREPQGFHPSRVQEAPSPLIEHYGKSVSVSEWERKVDFYVQHYPQYREKWLARRGAAVHDGLSDFATQLVRRGDAAFDPRTAPVIHRYRAQTGPRLVAKRFVYGLLSPSLLTLPASTVMRG